MRSFSAFIPFALILAAGCTAKPPGFPTATILPATVAPSTASVLPIPTVRQTEPAAPVAELVMVIDDFEGAQTDWTICTDPECTDSSAVSVALSSEYASQGKQALQIKYVKNDRPKALFFIQKPMDFSTGRYVKFDVFNPGTIDGVGFALTTGPNSTWHESDSVPVEAGKTTTLSFDLTADNYKTAATNWEFRATIADLNNVARLSIIIYPKVSGYAFIDNIDLTNTP
jgi:hypothetical protein